MYKFQNKYKFKKEDELSSFAFGLIILNLIKAFINAMSYFGSLFSGLCKRHPFNH